jgi:hypothetical protein
MCGERHLTATLCAKARDGLLVVLIAVDRTLLIIKAAYTTHGRQPSTQKVYYVGAHYRQYIVTPRISYAPRLKTNLTKTRRPISLVFKAIVMPPFRKLIRDGNNHIWPMAAVSDSNDKLSSILKVKKK